MWPRPVLNTAQSREEAHLSSFAGKASDRDFDGLASRLNVNHTVLDGDLQVHTTRGQGG